MVKKVAVIQDLSGLGKCSLTAAIPVISVMGGTHRCSDESDRIRKLLL